MRIMRHHTKNYLILLGVAIFLLWYFFAGSSSNYYGSPRPARYDMPPVSHGDVNQMSPFIFIGGVPRSGTTLMRAMLDAHPDVRCGEETRVIPRILGLQAQWKRSEKVIAGHGAPAPRLCNKDPFTMKSSTYLAELFPKAKFVFMIRDGRATVHSIISRKVTITGFDLNDFRQCLQKWNAAISTMYNQCQAVGDRCLQVYYEQLVLHPEPQMRRILDFLELPWNNSVLHHEELIGKDISLSKVERSSDQVVKPVNVDALSKWVGKIPEDVVAEMDSVAPMLRKLGYDPHANPPNYGKPDEVVVKKSQDVVENANKWYEKAVQVVNDPNRVDKPETFRKNAAQILEPGAEHADHENADHPDQKV
ncbi:hypothetical protein WR25_09237 [Diploscapter pachys]|uniref:Protein-tyrosine sulfotransferase n=1 Tax=Diploscapter pachys TaxID=2018661 RepID=A0A2A2KZX2_9BILA|nr:hypothetical protein WR25_09237 [Diploscapter pachys]